jgi:hypothetical protein
VERKRERPARQPGAPNTATATNGNSVILPDQVDPDLWVMLAALDRVFGADQVELLSVTQGRRS